MEILGAILIFIVVKIIVLVCLTGHDYRKMKEQEKAQEKNPAAGAGSGGAERR